jgi:hypothetical protein
MITARANACIVDILDKTVTCFREMSAATEKLTALTLVVGIPCFKRKRDLSPITVVLVAPGPPFIQKLPSIGASATFDCQG